MKDTADRPWVSRFKQQAPIVICIMNIQLTLTILVIVFRCMSHQLYHSFDRLGLNSIPSSTTIISNSPRLPSSSQFGYIDLVSNR